MRIQSITLPKHHLDKPGESPKCKDFALVTLTHSDDVAYVLQQWPWERRHLQDKDAVSSEVREATKHGFRAISKARWEQLNAEYLQWRHKLLDEIAKGEARQPAPVAAEAESILQLDTDEDHQIDLGEPAKSMAMSPQQDPSAPYPNRCLVHARHVHPETNKTTLRKLFSKAFLQEGTQQNEAVGIDYVDFNKGMDTVSNQSKA